MATTRWVTDDGRSYVGDEVRITWDTPGEHTVTQHLRAGGTVTHTVTTTEAPVEAWPVAEGILPAGLVPHEGTLVPTEIGGFEADGVTPATVLEPDPWVTPARGMIRHEWDRSDPDNLFASDVDPLGVQPWPEILDRMRAAAPAGRKVRAVFDHKPPAGAEWKDYAPPALGYTRGRMACYAFEGADDWCLGIAGEGQQRLLSPLVVDDTTLHEVWSVPAGVTETRPDGTRVWVSGSDLLVREGAVRRDGKLWMTPRQFGNVRLHGAQHELRLIDWVDVDVAALINIGVALQTSANGVIGCHGWQVRGTTRTVVMAHVTMNAASKGWAGAPPGETYMGQLVGFTGRLYMSDLDHDGRTLDGQRVAASPLGFSNCHTRTPWEMHRISFGENAVSMPTFWNCNIALKRFHTWSKRSAGPHLNEEDLNWEAWAHLLSVGDRIDVRSTYDGKGGTGGALHLAINSGPRAKDTHRSNQTWVNWEILAPSAITRFDGLPGDRCLNVQSQLGYQGVDSTMGETGPQELWVDGVTPPLGMRAWLNRRWQQIHSEKAEQDANGNLIPTLWGSNETGEWVKIQEAPMRKPKWPAGMAVDADKQVAVFR